MMWSKGLRILFVLGIMFVAGVEFVKADSPCTCYRAYCLYEPNTSYFDTSNSHCSALGTCARAENCATTRGAYSYSANLEFFTTTSSESNGILCYRSVCRHEINKLYFNTISSVHTLECYRGTSCNNDAGAYSVDANQEFFKTTDSTFNGIRCFRSTCRYDINQLYFNTISSVHTQECYRGTSCNTVAGAYSDVPNLDYFKTAVSSFNGITCYRATACNESKGAYASLDDNYFTSVERLSSIKCYNATGCASSAYSVSPDVMFFTVSSQNRTGKTCWRADGCNTAAGAGTDAQIDKVYFTRDESTASGKTCYRAKGCAKCSEASENTQYFVADSKTATGTTCFRHTCNGGEGTLSEKPNSAYFDINSESYCSTTCYRATGCSSCATTESPNTAYFEVSSSSASGHTCWIVKNCKFGNDTTYFVYDKETSNCNTCYKPKGCNESRGSYSKKPDETFFIEYSATDGDYTCYRSECRYLSSGDTTYFQTLSSTHTQQCWKAKGCTNCTEAVSKTCDANWFNTSSKSSNGYSCGRATCIAGVTYDTRPSNLYFTTSGSNCCSKYCYKAIGCNTSNGASDVKGDANYFTVSELKASGTTCYRGDCANPNANNTTYFKTSHSTLYNKTCYRADSCASYAYTSSTNCPTTHYSLTHKESNGLSCHRAECIYSSVDTSYFKTSTSSCSKSANASCSVPTGCLYDTCSDKYYKSGSASLGGYSCTKTTGCQCSTTVFTGTSKSCGGVSCLSSNIGCNTSNNYYNWGTGASATCGSKTCAKATCADLRREFGYNYYDTKDPDYDYCSTVTRYGVTCYNWNNCHNHKYSCSNANAKTYNQSLSYESCTDTTNAKCAYCSATDSTTCYTGCHNHSYSYCDGYETTDYWAYNYASSRTDINCTYCGAWSGYYCIKNGHNSHNYECPSSYPDTSCSCGVEAYYYWKDCTYSGCSADTYYSSCKRCKPCCNYEYTASDWAESGSASCTKNGTTYYASRCYGYSSSEISAKQAQGYICEHTCTTVTGGYIYTCHH